MVPKIAITLEQQTIAELDRWVREGKYPNRSKTFQFALTLLSDRQKRSRLTRELAKLNRAVEKQLAEEGIGTGPWPPY